MKTSPTARLPLTAILVLLSADARADDPPIPTVVPGHVFLVPGFSVRNGDWVAVEPSFWFTRSLIGPSRPIMLVARLMLGVGGSGIGIGFAPTLEPPCPTVETCKTPWFWLPFSLEAHVERMYGPTPWRSATYVGPQFSLSAYLLKTSLGWMVDASDRSDSHVQVAIGVGF
jgi:hypothetical protein